jgi:hypothetical protein
MTLVDQMNKVSRQNKDASRNLQLGGSEAQPPSSVKH